MSFISHLDLVLSHLLTQYQPQRVITAEQLVRCIDLTLLTDAPEKGQIDELKMRAQHYPVAAVCVAIPYLAQLNTQANLRLATVVNFPGGNSSVSKCLTEINNAINGGAQEIDYVFPYQTYLNNDKRYALNHYETIYQYCKKNNLLFKVILETGAFSEVNTVYELSKTLINIGCDFLKTSTGKIAQGASMPAAFALLSAIKDTGAHCGLKVSGGVKTVEQAHNFALLAELMMDKPITDEWFRIGTSSLLEQLVS